jgi:hypothetical protein
MERLGTILSVPLGIVWALAGPITWVLLVIDTWRWTSSVPVKLLVCVTLDGMLAALWPFTWVWWIIMYSLGHDTPLRVLFG